MDYKVELPDGSNIVLLYARKFDWRDKQQGEALGFEPLSGRVYRALKTKGDNNYYVHLTVPPMPGQPQIEGIRLTNLRYDTPEWSCDFVEIDDQNILDFDIITDDYEKIRTWLNNKQQDLIDRLFNPEGLDMTGSMEDDLNPSEGAFNITDASIQSPMDLVEYLKRALVPMDNSAMESIQWITMRDPFALSAISYLLKGYADYLKQEDNSPITPLPRDIGTSIELGATANITTMAAALNNHINNKSNGRNELFNMFVAILFDLMRQDITKKSN